MRRYCSLLPTVAAILALKSVLVESQADTCAGRPCYPATGNLLVGRENKLQVTSTCGTQQPERYCVVAELSDMTRCFTCDSRRPWSSNNRKSHNITNIVTSHSDDRLRRWWQAENGVQEVMMQLDLDAEFHFTHLMLTFKTFRPKAMYIERSFDFGATWLKYRYFAEQCSVSFPDIASGPVKSLKEPVICEEKYSNVLPATQGEVVFRVLPPTMRIEDPYAEEVQDLLKLTNIRVVFKELHTLGDDLLDTRQEIDEKYYYALYDMVVRGSCSCYGHASRCLPASPEDLHVVDMVYSICECTHNTKGKNCDQCADFYNDRPWMPAVGKETGECQKCECHDHATSCHFDPAVYHSRGNVSGGVCDNCMHNTDGLNCETCKSHFYQDPSKDIRDQDICQPCDCDPTGTENNGECDMKDDALNGFVAGRCKCKQNVGGPRCDRCQTGYWDFQETGCEECECNTLGTYGNEGCNQYTGKCQCKRFVTGRNCDECLPEHWGLSKIEEGCNPCGCDIGGSHDNMCDEVTGQCNCKPGIQGRACDKPIDRFFIPDLSYLRYEAETATGIGNTHVVLREKRPGYPVTWTGHGFMRTFEGGAIEFTIDNVPYSMNFEIVIRYEKQMDEGWDDVRITVQRPGLPDLNGPCSNSLPQGDILATSLSAGSRYDIVTPSICLEQGNTYYIRLDFERYNSPVDTPNANILIDSIALIPVVTDIPVRPGTTPITPSDLTFCYNLEHDATTMEDLPENCKRMMFSIGAAVTNQAYDCGCDPTGSESTICNPYGGLCQCKPNVFGRRCDQCRPGTYGFGPTGCTECNCNNQGSRDNFCNPIDGFCQCQFNIAGRACDRCEAGMFSFPNCRDCICNGHADTCEDRTGECRNCRDSTTGLQCDSCVAGYYGDPRLGSSFPCLPCTCPGGEGSGIQHADECILDRAQNSMRCFCPPEFAGDECDQCAQNHFGNPLEVNGTCQSCAEGCNYNIDMRISDSCDQTDGTCLRCQFDTEGDSCELCAWGFYGDATAHSCVACVCNWLGSVRDADEKCDRSTGKCPCHPNVEGDMCDQCAENHWGLALGNGCVACDCDPEGSVGSQCNEFDGQCECKDGRGGKKCDQCILYQWGDPSIECLDCNCTVDGSASLQCDPDSGQCPCLEGITGMHCDRCDRGTTGILPNCAPCGECFDSWDDILDDLKGETAELLAQVDVTKTEGAVGVYDEQFMSMEKQLMAVQAILNGFNQTAANMTSLLIDFEKLRTELTLAQGNLTQLRNSFKEHNQNLARSETEISGLTVFINELRVLSEAKKAEVDANLQQDINGAFNTIKNNNKLSDQAVMEADETSEILDEANKFINTTRMLLTEMEEEFDRQYNETNNEIQAKQLDVEVIRANLISVDGLNKQVCDWKDVLSPDMLCDDTCGGGGCDSCGGESCTDGAAGKVAQAQIFGDKAQMTATKKNDLAVEQLDKYVKTLELVAVAHKEAEDTNEYTKEVYQKANESKLDLSETIARIESFVAEDKAVADDVIVIVDAVLALSINMSQSDIEELAMKINQTIQNLTNIDQILNETAADLARSQMLKERADNASAEAEKILVLVNELNDKLSQARQAQNLSEAALAMANGNITAITNALQSIGDIMADTVDRANALLEVSIKLLQYVNEVSVMNTKNIINLNWVEDGAMTAETDSNAAKELADDIATDYDGVNEIINTSYNETMKAFFQSEELLRRAEALATKLTTKSSKLETLERDLNTNEAQMEDLSKEIEKLILKMDVANEALTESEQFHKVCQPQ